MFYHKDINGRKYVLSELTDNHLLNIINNNRKSAKRGILVECNVYNYNDESMEYHDELLKDEKALIELNQNKYIQEANRRELKIVK